MTHKSKKRYQVEFGRETAEYMDELRVAAGACSRRALVEQAIQFYDWAISQHQAGNMIQSVTKSGESVSCVLLFKRLSSPAVSNPNPEPK